jgi:transposase
LIEERTISPGHASGWHVHLIGRIIERKYGYTSHHRTIKRFLERNPIPVQLPLEITHFHQFEDAYRARFTVVRMYYEGWHQQSIATCLGLSRKQWRKIAPRPYERRPISAASSVHQLALMVPPAANAG